MSIPNTATSTGIEHTFQSLFDVSTKPYISDNIIKVNSTGTGLVQAAASSLIIPSVGSGVAGHIPIFKGSYPPIFSDSGVNVDIDQNITNIGSLLTASNIYLGPSIGGGDTGNILDLNLQNPENQTLFYDATSQVVILGANVNGGDPADLVLINGPTGSTGANNIYVANNNSNGIIGLIAPVLDVSTTSVIVLNETTDSHVFQMDNTGVLLSVGDTLPLSIVTLGNPGSVGDVLTNLSGGAGWAPAAGGGSNPTLISIPPFAFKYFSQYPDHIGGPGTALIIGTTIINPPDTSTNAVSPYDFGNVTFSAAAGSYNMNTCFVYGNPGNGTVQVTLNSVIILTEDTTQYGGVNAYFSIQTPVILLEGANIINLQLTANGNITMWAPITFTLQ